MNDLRKQQIPSNARRLIAELLFASMPALHNDTPRRKMAMYSRALEMLGELRSPARAKQKV